MHEKRVDRVILRVTAEQRALWQQAAASEKRTLSDWARLALDSAAGADPVSGVDVIARKHAGKGSK